MMSMATFFRGAYNLEGFSGTVAFNPRAGYAVKLSGVSTPTLTLPDATTLAVDTYGILWNSGATTITVKDASGATVGTLATDIPKELALFLNTTAAGSWRLLTRAFL